MRFGCWTKLIFRLPFQLEDAARKVKESEKQITVSQDIRLDNRVIDLRTPANQAIMRIKAKFGKSFRDFLDTHSFVEIHTPKLVGGASEGGSQVFETDYYGRKACLAQSPQFYKQMAVLADFGRVFEFGPVFRAEDSNTNRHL